MSATQADMIWITFFWLHMFPNLQALPSLILDINNATLNKSEMLADSFMARKQKEYSADKEKCTMPCELTAKLLLDEKHSVCSNIQHAMTTYTRSTRKLIRDLIDEQQKTLEFLSSQVMDLMTKVNTLSLEIQRSNSDTSSVKLMHAHGRDCSDIKETLEMLSPKIPSGVYIIQPENSDLLFEVFCEMDYMQGGWTVIQRRTDGLTDFKRTWSEYVDGFGPLPGQHHSWSLCPTPKSTDTQEFTSREPGGEHWLGLRKVFGIVNQKNTRFQLHISLVSQNDSTAFASYDNFGLEDENKSFAIQLGRYVGSAGDAFRGYEQEQNQDTAPFSTFDVDNDGCFPFCTFDDKAVESCSVNYNNTGWWFNQCGKANLNGSPLDQDRSTQSHLHWDTWTKNGEPVSIKSVTMKIKRAEGSNLK